MDVSELLSTYWPGILAVGTTLQMPTIIKAYFEYKSRKASLELDKKAALDKVETDTQAGEAAQNLKERQDFFLKALNDNERLQKGWTGCEEAREALRKEVLALSIQVGINSKAVNSITQAVNDKILPENEKLEIFDIQPRIQAAMDMAEKATQESKKDE